MVSPIQSLKQPQNKPYKYIDLGFQRIAIVDDYNFQWLRKYPWEFYQKQRNFYARYTIDHYARPIYLWMHRLVANTQPRMVCHHRNRNTLDNRRANLINMTPKDHQALHQNHTLLIKFAEIGPQATPLEGFF